ncbi:MAG TPA: NHLP leader peptide family RiPP precursor [Elusimicrobiota bacterium]|nr:NHLP leader peptide family RiPP precursor [Elusimicrobiota bacterium]
MSEIDNAKEAREKIIKKSLTDAGFRKALLADAGAAIEKELGVKLPSGIKVNVLEDTTKVVHLVLPAATNKSELSEAELGKVSGGFGLPSTKQHGCVSSNTNTPGCVG